MVPLSSTTLDVVRASLSTRVARCGTPLDITYDRGSQFASELWSALAWSLGVQVHHITTCYPQANGLCKHFHWSLKMALRAVLFDRPFALGYARILAPKEDLNAVPAEPVLSQPLCIPGEFLTESSARRSPHFLSGGALIPIHHCFPWPFMLI